MKEAARKFVAMLVEHVSADKLAGALMQHDPEYAMDLQAALLAQGVYKAFEEASGQGLSLDEASREDNGVSQPIA